MISNPYHGGHDFAYTVLDAYRAVLPTLDKYQFLRVGSVDVNVVVRIYSQTSELVGSYTGAITGTAKDLATLIGETALPTGSWWAEVDHLSDGAATYFYIETGTPDANSKQVATNISSGAKQMLMIGNYPQD